MKKVIILIFSILAIAVIGYVFYGKQKQQIKEAIINHDNYLHQTVATQSSPLKPKSYKDLEYIYEHYKPMTPYSRMAIYDALHIDKANDVPFEDTKVYSEWEDIERDLEPLF